MGLKTPPKRHLLRIRHDRQRLQAASLLARNGGAAAAVRKGSHRIAKAKTRSAGNSARRINPKNLAKDLPDNRQRRGRPLGRKLSAAIVRRSGLRKMARRNAEQGKRRIGSAGKPAAQINLNNLFRDLLLSRQVICQRGRPLGRELKRVTARHSGLRKMARRNAEQGKRRISSAGKAAEQTNRNRRKPLHRRSHRRPTALVVVRPHASEVSAAGVSKIRPKSLARAAGVQSGLTDSESRPKLRKHLLKMFSNVARAGKTPVRSKRVARPQSAANRTLNSSGRAATKKLKVRSPAAHKASSKNRGATAKRAREKRVTPKAKARATHRAAKERARRDEASRHSPAYSRLS